MSDLKPRSRAGQLRYLAAELRRGVSPIAVAVGLDALADEPDPLAAVYRWLVGEIGIDTLTEKPDWLDIRTAAEHWLALDREEAPEGLRESVEDYIELIYAETRWER